MLLGFSFEPGSVLVRSIPCMKTHLVDVARVQVSYKICLAVRAVSCIQCALSFEQFRAVSSAWSMVGIDFMFERCCQAQILSILWPVTVHCL